jgi:single-stranded-DNA-specific exonuclease
MLRRRRWTIADPNPAAADLARSLNTSPLIAQILLNRQLDDPANCRAFLQPSLKMLHEPAAIPGLKRAADRVADAVRNRDKVVIYGDYDVDGITATAILWHALRLLGGDVHYYIPHRIDEGYGLNAEAVKQLCDDGAKLIITVDCGVTAIDPVAVARDRGVDVIVTDHHEWKEMRNEECGTRNDAAASEASSHSPFPIPHSALASPLLPNAFAIVHPRLPHDGPAYPNPHLCGAGVAFKLAWGVAQAVCGSSRVSDEMRMFLVDATALAALGTIADVVPLVGENRTLASFGLSGLRHTKLTGIRALIDSAGLGEQQKIDSYHVGFLLAPRLNACGRMGHARLAVEMLTTADEPRAIEIATFLESQNKLRQATERKILDEAVEQVEELGLARDDCFGIVLGSESWHPGVIGIVASRIVEKYCRPTIMVALGEGHGHGSGRSINGFHLSRALEACGHLLDSHGGHEMAAGCRVKRENFDAFRAAFAEHAAGVLSPENLIPELRIDCCAELGQINEAVVKELARMGPFGPGNRKPVLACRNVELAAEPRRVGKKGDHLQLFVRQNGVSMKAIAFGAGPLFDQLRRGTSLDLAVEPQLNEWNGYVNVELEVKDVVIG